MRYAAPIALLLAVAAWAHVFTFDFVFDRSVANFADDAGVAHLQWVDRDSPGGMAMVRIFATQRALDPSALPMRMTWWQ